MAKKKLEGWKTEKKIEGSLNDPLYVSKLTYHVVISVWNEAVNVLTDFNVIYLIQYLYKLYLHTSNTSKNVSCNE